jgi:hypothetical protein
LGLLQGLLTAGNLVATSAVKYMKKAMDAYFKDQGDDSE